MGSALSDVPQVDYFEAVRVYHPLPYTLPSQLNQEKSGGQAQEREEWEQSNWKDERRLEDQQRIGLDKLLDVVQDTNLQPREDI